MFRKFFWKIIYLSLNGGASQSSVESTYTSNRWWPRYVSTLECKFVIAHVTWISKGWSIILNYQKCQGIKLYGHIFDLGFTPNKFRKNTSWHGGSSKICANSGCAGTDDSWGWRTLHILSWKHKKGTYLHDNDSVGTVWQIFRVRLFTCKRCGEGDEGKHFKLGMHAP